MFKQKSVWPKLGIAAKGRDANLPSAPVPVSEDPQGKIKRSDARLFEFALQNRGRDQLPQRPSTSAGPDSSLSKRKNAERRETKDDLHFHFGPLGPHGKGTTIYNFPLPGVLPTPAITPRSSPPPQKAFFARPLTPDSTDIAPARMEPPPMEIGMALGSPAHPPPIYQPDPAESLTRNHSPDHMDGSVDGWVNSPPMVNRKPSKWKTLGGLFGGRKNTQAFYQLQQEVPQLPPAEQYVHVEQLLPSDNHPKSQGRGQTSSERKSKKTRPKAKRSNAGSINSEHVDTNRQHHAQTPEITLEGRRLGDNGLTQTTPHSGGLLDIDIPIVQMERYSIMFSGVLQKSGPRQSLLARRQATLDKLKNINEAIASKEQELDAMLRQPRSRRASSPQQTKSPAFSLFPSTPSRAREGSSSPYRSNLQRSNTSPALLSPSRPTFAPGPGNETHAKTLAAAAVAVTNENQEKQNLGAEVQTPNRRGGEPKAEPEAESEQIADSPTFVSLNPKWPTEESHLALDSSDADVGEFEAEDAYDPAPLLIKPALPEPHWQMITPANVHTTTSSTSGSTTSRSDHSTSTSASSIMTSPSVITTPQFSKQAVQSPRTGRSRATTTTAPPPASGRHRSATVSNSTSQIPRRSSNNHTPTSTDQEAEQCLKNAADVSIARQISVSRQQRQLLVPIKSALKQPKNNNLEFERVNVTDFPAPASGIGAIGVGRVASPLGEMAVAAQEEIERSGSPFVGRGDRERVPKVKRTTERLVEGVKPATPTLVVVGDSKDENYKFWQGTNLQHATAKNSPMGLAERRRRNAHKHLHLSNMGEIRVGLAVEAVQARELQHRKSEKAVVERISVASN